MRRRMVRVFPSLQDAKGYVTSLEQSVCSLQTPPAYCSNVTPPTTPGATTSTTNPTSTPATFGIGVPGRAGDEPSREAA